MDNSAARRAPFVGKSGQRSAASTSLSLASHEDEIIFIPGMSALPQDPNVCAVCNDEASGRHYGTMACFGCKGFFRRSIRDGKKYHCRYDHNCCIEKSERNTCRACRLQKCKDVGMVAEAIKPDRDKNGRQIHRRRFSIGVEKVENVSKRSYSGSTVNAALLNEVDDLETVDLEDNTILTTLTELELICNNRRDAEPLFAKKSISGVDMLTRPSLLFPRTELKFNGSLGECGVKNFYENVRRLAVLVLDYVNTLEPIADMESDEKVGAAADTIYLPNGQKISRNANLLADDKRYVVFQSRIETVKSAVIDQVLGQIFFLHLTDDEYAALKAIAVLDPHAPKLSISSRNLLHVARESVQNALFNKLSAKFSKSDAASRFSNLFLLLATVTRVAAQITGLMQLSRDLGLGVNGMINELFLRDKY